MGLGAFPRRALARRVRGGCFGVLRALTSTGGQAATPGCSGNFFSGTDGPISGHIWHCALFLRFPRTTQNPDIIIIWARPVLRYVSKRPSGQVLGASRNARNSAPPARIRTKGGWVPYPEAHPREEMNEKQHARGRPACARVYRRQQERPLHVCVYCGILDGRMGNTQGGLLNIKEFLVYDGSC